MSEIDVWKQFPKTVAEWAHRNLKVSWSDDLPTAGVILCKDGYHLDVNQEWFMSFSDDHKKDLLIHEVSHVLRGDCLVPHDKEGYENHKLRNLAMDAIINENVSLHDFTDSNKGIRIGTSLETIGIQLRQYSFSWMSTYKELEQELGKDYGENSYTIDAAPSNDNTPSDDLKTEHAKAVLDARDAFGGTELENIANVNTQGLSASNGKGTKHKLEFPTPIDTNIPSAILKAAGHNGARIKTRSYARPGRIEGLKGSPRPPIAKVVCAMDVSGSMTSYWPIVSGAAASLMKKLDVELATFSTVCKKFKFGQEIENWNGGTEVTPVFEYAKKSKADVLAIFTDAEFYDFNPNSIDFNGKILFFVPENYKTSHVEAVGTVIRLKNS